MKHGYYVYVCKNEKKIVFTMETQLTYHNKDDDFYGK